MNRTAQQVAAHAGRIAIRVLRKSLPASNTVVVHGFPDDEENSLRLAGASAAYQRDGWSTVLLCEDVQAARTAFRFANANATYHVAEPQYLLKNTVAGMTAFIRAKYLFYTHNIFRSPDPGQCRFDINVGHGHGPKRAENVAHHVAHRADLAIVNNERWGGDVVEVQGLRRGGQLSVLHNPREDAFREAGEDRDKLRKLGVDPDKPSVAWLPTYRRTITMLNAQWQDGTPLSETPGTAEDLERMAALAVESGVQLVTKFHPLDAEAGTDVPGMITVTADALQDAELSFYQFIGLTDGLISDYSSIYVDYIVAGKPWALYFRDAEDFTKARGFNEPDFRECAADLIFESDDDVREFFAAVAAHKHWRKDSVDRFATAIDLAQDGYSSTLNLLRVAQTAASRKGLPHAFDLPEGDNPAPVSIDRREHRTAATKPVEPV